MSEAARCCSERKKLSKKLKPYHIWNFSSIFASFQHFLPCFTTTARLACGTFPLFRRVWTAFYFSVSCAKLFNAMEPQHEAYEWVFCSYTFIAFRFYVDWLTETGNIGFAFYRHTFTRTYSSSLCGVIRFLHVKLFTFQANGMKCFFFLLSSNQALAKLISASNYSLTKSRWVICMYFPFASKLMFINSSTKDKSDEFNGLIVNKQHSRTAMEEFNQELTSFCQLWNFV